jgi:hypothetical protein
MAAKAMAAIRGIEFLIIVIVIKHPVKHTPTGSRKSVE